MKKMLCIFLLSVSWKILSSTSQNSFLLDLDNDQSGQLSDNQNITKSRKKSKSLKTTNTFLSDILSTDTSDKILQKVDKSAIQKSHNSKSVNNQNSFLSNINSNNESQQSDSSMSFVSSYYGNSKYQAAMNILNDNQLQQAYSQNIKSIQRQIADYSQQMIKPYKSKGHQVVEQEQKEKQKLSIVNFVQGLQSSQLSIHTQQDSMTQKKSKNRGKSNSNEYSSFVVGLEG